MKSKILGLLAVGLLAGPTVANAVVVTMDDPYQTVVRPDSGFVRLDFTGTVTFGPEETYNAYAVFSPWQDDGVTTLGVGGNCVVCEAGGSGLLFSIFVYSTDQLGMYDNDFFVTGPSRFALTANLPTGGTQTVEAPYSVNVVSTVPEPGTLALLGLGLAGLGLSRRRKAN